MLINFSHTLDNLHTLNKFNFTFTSSCSQIILKIDRCLKRFAIFTGKHLCRSLFLITLHAFNHATLFQKVSSTGVLLINFISTYSKSLQNFIYARFPLIEGYKQGALQKELIFAPFVERFKTGTLRKLPDNFISTYSKLLKHFIFARFLLIEGYEQGALRKELIFAPFVERFKTGTLRKPS